MRVELEPEDLSAIAAEVAAQVLAALRPLLAKAPAEERLMTIEEAAKHLGVTVGWIYKRTAGGEIPCRKIGRFVKFSRRELDDWVARNGRVPQTADAPGGLRLIQKTR